MEKRVITMIIQSFTPTIGGAEKQCLELSRALVKKGFAVRVLTRAHRKAPRRQTIDGISVKRIGFGDTVTFLLALPFYLISNLSRQEAWHVHLAASHAVMVAFLGKIFGKPVIVKVGGGNKVGEIALSRKGFLGRLKLRALGWLKPNFVIVNSDQKQEFSGFDLDKAPLYFIPNGVDLAAYHPLPPAERNRLRQRLGWNGITFLFVGRFSDNKLPLVVFEQFLMAWKQELGKNPTGAWRLVGEGPLKEGYQGLIDRYGSNSSVVLMSSQENVAEFYQAADVFVLPSLTEGLSNALLEAMACGLPVLGSRVSGITNMIVESKQGYLFDPLNSEEIGTALHKMNVNFEARIKQGDENQAKSRRYDLEDVANKYLALYNA